MSQTTANYLFIRTSGAGSNDPSIAPDTFSKPQKRPRRRFLRKLFRSAAIAAGEEVLASFFAKDRGKHGHYVTSRVPKMALYGAFINTPLTHFLLKGLRALFKGRESSTARVLEILVGMLVVAPIKRVMHLLSIGLIVGARTFNHFRAIVRVALFQTMVITWLVVPTAVAFAQNVLPSNVWPLFFGLVSFAVDTYTNTYVKKKRLAALRNRFYGGHTKDTRAKNDISAVWLADKKRLEALMRQCFGDQNTEAEKILSALQRKYIVNGRDTDVQKILGALRRKCFEDSERG